MTINLPPRILHERLVTARTLSSTIKGAFTAKQWRTWQEMEDIYGIDLNRLTPDGSPWSAQGRVSEASQYALDLVMRTLVERFPYWAEEDAAKADIERAAEPSVTESLFTPSKHRLRLTPESQCWRFPNSELSLYPEQDPVVRLLMEKWFPSSPGVKPVNHMIVPGGCGSGKTIIAAAAVCRAIMEHNYHKPPASFPLPVTYSIHWPTVPNAVEQTIREVERAGLSQYIGNAIHIYGWNSLAYSEALGRLTEEVFIEPEEDPFADPDEPKPKAKRLIRYLPHAVGRLYIFDECHKLANEDTGISRTIAHLKELITAQPWLETKSLWLSGTPFEKVDDAKLFVTFADINFGGMRITPKTFKTSFANPIAKGRPDVPSVASMERLYGAIKNNVIEIPYVAWPRKAINSVLLVDFESEADREYVNGAWERHLDRCKALGKDSPNGVGAVYASLTIFRKEVEHVRMPQVVRRMVEAVKSGRSAVCGTAFTGAVIKGCFDLLDNYGFTREDFGVCWGGRKNVRPDRILSQEDMMKLIEASLISGEGLSLSDRRLIKRNLAWQEDGLLFGDQDDAERQSARYARLQKLGLIGVQTKDRRQREIDKFQSGRAKFFFFTMASGGTGLSLPHCDSRQTPRTGFFTSIYSGKDFNQAIWRDHRRNSISDTYNYCVLLRNTIESEHVGPILDNKLKSGAAFGSKKSDIMLTLANLFTKQAAEFQAKREFGIGNVRSVEQAVADALSSEDTQFHGGPADDEDDDEMEAA